MDKKQLSKIGIISLLVFLLGFAVVKTSLGVIPLSASTKESQAELIKNLNLEKAQHEIKIAEIKPICAELDNERFMRDTVQNKINNAINGLFPQK